jgi:hypothetical protein
MYFPPGFRFKRPFLYFLNPRLVSDLETRFAEHFGRVAFATRGLAAGLCDPIVAVGVGGAKVENEVDVDVEDGSGLRQEVAARTIEGDPCQALRTALDLLRPWSESESIVQFLDNCPKAGEFDVRLLFHASASPSDSKTALYIRPVSACSPVIHSCLWAWCGGRRCRCAYWPRSGH